MSLRMVSILAVAALALIMLAGVLSRPLMPIDETRYLAVAWEMWSNGEFFVLTRNFELYTHKPPLLFWSINLVWAFTGVSETAARLVGPAYGLIGIVLTGALARRLWPEDAGIGARTILALCGLVTFAFWAELTMFDAMLATATVAGVLALVMVARTGEWRWWLAVGAALALGALSKGPVILLHLMPAMMLAPAWADRAWNITWRATLIGTGIALVTGVAIVALWLGPALVMGGPEYRVAVLWTQSAGRMANSFAHARPWWFFLAMMPVLMFPWIFVPTLWRAAARTPWAEPGLRLALLWAVPALVMFSLISGKQVHYLVPELPAVALIVGRLTRDAGAFRLIWAAMPLALGALVAVAAAAGLIPLGDVAALVQPRSMLLAWALLAAAICWMALSLGGLRGGVVLTLGTLLSVNLFIGLTDMREIYDTHRIAEAIAPHEDAGIAFIGQGYHAEFNFAGRLTRAVDTPEGIDAIQAWLAAHPDGIVLGRPDRASLPWRPDDTILFRGSPYALWRVAEAQ